MKLLSLISTMAVLYTAGIAYAQGDSMPITKPSLSATESVTTTARVEAIDHETREVTLLLADGDTVTSRASDEVRNLDQVSVGDIVYAHYTDSVSIQVVADDGAAPEAYVAVSTAIVEAINLEDNTFKLREADGEVRQYTARNPDNLRRAEVGDKVIVTVTHSVVVTVSKQPAD